MTRISGVHFQPGEREALARDLAEWLKSSGNTATGFARARGLRPCTMQEMARNLRLTAPAQLRPEFVASPVPSAEMPNADLIAHLAARSRKHRDRFTAEKNRRIKISTSDPFAIVWFTDVHLGDNGTAYDLLLKHCHLTADTPHTFGVFMGDASNSWPVNGKLGRIWAEQETSKHQERQLVDWLLNDSGVPWLFWALGNHDLWADGETILRSMNADLVPMAAWGAKLTLEFANGRECRMDLAHDHKGHSMWNSLHAETKAAQMGWSADFVFSGHRHNAALHFEEFPARNQASWLMRASGYKKADHYAFENGFPEQSEEGSAGVTIFDPRTNRMNPIVHASLNVEEGLDYLKFLRAR
jgi:hypothetical protein